MFSVFSVVTNYHFYDIQKGKEKLKTDLQVESSEADDDLMGYVVIEFENKQLDKPGMYFFLKQRYSLLFVIVWYLYSILLQCAENQYRRPSSQRSIILINESAAFNQDYPPF